MGRTTQFACLRTLVYDWGREVGWIWLRNSKEGEEMAANGREVLSDRGTGVATVGVTDVGAQSPGRAKRKRKHYTGRAQGADETRRLDEARAKLVAVRGKIGQFARELMREVYGEQGPEWGTRFRDIEILGDVIGAEVASRFTEGSVEEQAEHVPPKARLCPCCGGDGERQADDEPRSVKTLTGVISWEEAQFFCEPCRRSFFPPERRFGD
jgi:hypothetical protein